MLLEAVGGILVVTLTMIFLIYMDIQKHKKAKTPLNFRKVDLSKIPKIEEKRKNPIKTRFVPGKTKLPSKIDYIIIGSGISGLSCASALARCGRKVVVLEQHDRLGGCMHTYSKGYNFDVGIHYVGNKKKCDRYLSVYGDPDMPVEWVSSGTKEDEFTYDRYVIGQGTSCREYSARKDKRIEDLREAFPDAKDQKALDEFEKLCKQADITMGISMLTRFLHPFFTKLAFVIGKWMYPKVWARSIREVLHDIMGHNPAMVMAICANIGDIGGNLSNNLFGMLSGLFNHYVKGGYYIKGGPNRITLSLISNIEKYGGRCLANAPISSLLFDESKTRVIGVNILRGDTEIPVTCRCGVISSAGFHVTYAKIAPVAKLPKELSLPSWFTSGVTSILKKVPPSVQHFQVFIGMNKSQEELKLPAYNTWFMEFEENDKSLNYDDFIGNFHKDPLHAPLMGFIGFPSAKDPEYNVERPDKSVCVIVSEVPSYHFNEYANTPVKGRGEEYKSLKQAIGQRFVDYVCNRFPQMKEAITKVEYGTALTAQYYLGSSVGESYGMHHSKERFFDRNFIRILQPQQPIPGFYLSGQDIVTAGFTGGLSAGITTASALLGYCKFPVIISGRSLTRDLRRMDGLGN